MLTITPGKCGDDNRVVSKNVEWGTPINCSVYHECSIMSPVFLLEYNSSLVNYNYLKVESWGRYYFIMDMTVAPGGRIYLTCSEDVLMSNKDAILKLNTQVVRNEKTRNKLIVDNRYPAEIKSTLGVFNFSETPFDLSSGYNIVMTVVGGKLT